MSRRRLIGWDGRTIVHPFAEVFDAATVVALAGPWVHERGEGYRRSRRVGPLTLRAGRLEATVRGTFPYSVELWAARGKQWGGRTPKANGRHLNGDLHDQMPTGSAVIPQFCTVDMP